MNAFSKSLCLIFVGAAVLLAGCPKKPRPSPDQTMVGLGGATNVAPTPVDTSSTQGLVTDDIQPGSRDERNLDRTLLAPVYFDFDRSAIKPTERPKLEQAAKWLADNKGKRVLLEGHCDWRGTTEYNLGLGDRRANAVKEYLQKLGVDVSRLEILSKGDLDAKENASATEMGKDRRVELAVMKQ